MSDTTYHRASSGRGWSALRAAGVLYAFGTALHTFDHLRRGAGSVSPEVREVGALATLAAVIVLALILTRHPLAPLFAVLAALPHGFGILAVHWLPHWSAVSDSFVSHDASLLSWLAVALEVAGAFAVGLAGLAVLARRSRPGQLAWLVELVAAITVLRLGIGAVGVDWALVRVLAGFVAVFGVLALASWRAPREWMPTAGA